MQKFYVGQDNQIQGPSGPLHFVTEAVEITKGEVETKLNALLLPDENNSEEKITSLKEKFWEILNSGGYVTIQDTTFYSKSK